MLGKISVPTRKPINRKLDKLHNDELHYLKAILHKLLITITLMKRKNTGCVKSVQRLEETYKCTKGLALNVLRRLRVK